MNKVAVSQDGNIYYVVSIRRQGEEYYPASKKIDVVGNVQNVYSGRCFQTKKDAERMACSMIRTKQKRKNYVEVQDIRDVPDAIVGMFEVDPDMQLSEDEMIDFMKSVYRERYMIFKDVFGLEDRFDLGVEYLAEVMNEQGIMVVYDVYGEPCKCNMSRFKWAKRTEDSLELVGKMMHG